MAGIDPSKLGQWFDQYARSLMLYARQWLNEELAEDAVQDSFVKLVACDREPSHIKPYLFKMVRHAAISRFRSRKRRQRREQRVAADRPNWFVSDCGDRLDAQAMRAELERLPMERREPVILRIWADLTFKEIGEVLGIPTATAYGRYQAAIGSLMERMDQPCQNHTTDK
jgi:RNA polymerase sigma-70 factor (ECF subfamily)